VPGLPTVRLPLLCSVFRLLLDARIDQRAPRSNSGLGFWFSGTSRASSNKSQSATLAAG